MKSIAIFLLTVSGFAMSAQNMCPIQLFCTGKIVNKIDLGEACGFSKLASVVEFEVIRFSDASYQQTSLPVVIRCPEMYGENYFEVGKTYEIVIEKEVKIDPRNDFSYRIQNPELLSKYDLPLLYWAINGNIQKL